MTVRLLHGDCRTVLRTLPEASVDAIVTDPPYELGFMGKAWDSTGIANSPEMWAEALRVLRPGGYLLAFSGTRTYHRMVCAIEDAGFEVRDQLAWVYGSGFPKSHNGPWGGTALKPAWEPICMARKPLIGTVEANWREHGTGALNIDGCRAASASKTPNAIYGAGMTSMSGGTDDTGFDPNVGRWPANLIHDGSDEVLACFPYTASGTGAVKRASSADGHGNAGSAFGAESRSAGTPMICHGDEGSAARFFYCAKADRADRNEGLGALHEPQANMHPTVKPTDLMRWLCRLVTPPGGTVLDPFAGSGSTLKAAELEGFSAIGIELNAVYIEIARRRIAADAPLFSEVEAA